MVAFYWKYSIGLIVNCAEFKPSYDTVCVNNLTVASTME